MPQGPSLHSKFQMSSNAPIETSFQMSQEPAKNLPFQVCQSPLVTPRSLMQSSLSVLKRDLGQQESQSPSRQSSIQMQPGPVMDPGLPTLRSLLVCPSQQIPSRSSLRSRRQRSLRPMVLSAEYGDRQTSPLAPKKHRKARTVYSPKQKRLLQNHFHHCATHPKREQCMALALLVGVTANEIQVSLSLFPVSDSHGIHHPPPQTPELLCGLKCLGQFGQLWKVNIHASRAEPHILLHPGYQHG